MDEQTKKASQAIVRARTQLVMAEPFFGSLALRLKPVAADITDTMATDGTHLFYNPKWVLSITAHQLRGVICHEVLHCTNGHPWRRKARDDRKWNYACDYAINPLVKEAGHELPPDGLIDKQFKGLSAEAIYNKLPPDAPNGGGNGQGNGQGKNQPMPAGGVMDAPNQQEHAQQQAEWQVAMRQAAQMAKARGRLPASLGRLVDELVRPKVDWKSELRRFVQQAARNDYAWRRPNGRYLHAGLYLPSLYSEEMPPLVIAVDTSGSIGEKELRQFASEISAISDECRPSRIYVQYIDAMVHKVDEFEPGDVVRIKPIGGGGTSFIPAFEWVEKHQVEPACLIYLTDMYGDFPKQPPEYPVMWVATSDRDAPFGETLRLEIEQ